MADIISLTKVRKARAKAEKAATAAANRARFGLTQAEKTGAGTAAERAARRLDGHRLEGDRPSAGDCLADPPAGGDASKPDRS
jgi:hypothetical protein